MLFPKPLQLGERVGLAAPASPVTKEELALSMDSLRGLGYEVTAGESLKSSAGSDRRPDGKERAAELNTLFAHPDIKAVFCIRGGYGSAQILEYLDYGSIRKNPKIFMGYSDITNLHTVLQKFCGLVTFHGPMVKSDMMPGMDAYTFQSMMETLRMGQELEFKNPKEQELHMLISGSASGILTGGNLAVLARACGTFYQPDTRGRLLFLEDVGESLDRVEMYLTQMEHAGVLTEIGGVLLGDFTQTEGDTDAFFTNWFKDYGIPVISNIYSDHRKRMGTLPFGANCVMDAKIGKISFFR